MTPEPKRQRKQFVRLTPIEDPAAFGTRLREARLAAGLSLRQLAFPGCSASYVSRLENGSRMPSLQLVNALAAKLGVPSETLLGGAPEPAYDELLVEGEVALRLGDHELARQRFRTVVDCASEDTRARALGGLAHLLVQSGETEEAIQLLEESRELLADRFAETARLVETLGMLRAMRSEFDQAVALFEAGREAAVARGDRSAALRFTLLIANTYIDLGALPASAEELSAALREADAIGDLDLRARTLWSQSRLHTVEGRHDQAAELARRSLAVLEVAEDELSVARLKHVLAYIELERGDPAAALELLGEGLPLVERAADADELALFRLEQARALALLGELEEAREIAIEVSPVLLRARRGDAGRCFATLGAVWAAVGESERAEAMYDAAIETLAGHRSPHLIRAYRQKAELLEARGDSDGALELLKQATDVDADVRVPRL